ncbi:hypothetical protein [Bdellovibrio bacteriovorus]|uniref:hypothetical protein n=1 Tax=Bdellovibrio bacteriovorus TaxID=959 RepID=UPI0035A70B10
MRAGVVGQLPDPQACVCCDEIGLAQADSLLQVAKFGPGVQTLSHGSGEVSSGAGQLLSAERISFGDQSPAGITRTCCLPGSQSRVVD